MTTSAQSVATKKRYFKNFSTMPRDAGYFCDIMALNMSITGGNHSEEEDTYHTVVVDIDFVDDAYRDSNGGKFREIDSKL